MNQLNAKQRRTFRTRRRIRRPVDNGRMRLSVFRSARYIYAQVIDDLRGVTLASAASVEASLRSQLEGSTGSKKAARLVGETVAERAKAQGLEKVVFDRGGYIYHGKVREVADGARDKGLQF